MVGKESIAEGLLYYYNGEREKLVNATAGSPSHNSFAKFIHNIRDRFGRNVRILFEQSHNQCDCFLANIRVD